MKIIERALDGLVLMETEVYGDKRGWFTESFNEKDLEELGIYHRFIQDNHSFSACKGTIRGLHYQKKPKAQAKLVRCTRGKIFDVAVDIRKESASFGKWFGVELTEENKYQLFIPEGFAHGFITLTDDVEVQYKVNEVYSPQHDRNIIWDDPTINIDWPLNKKPILSEKDQEAPYFNDLRSEQ